MSCMSDFNAKMKWFLFTLSRMEALEMQEFSSEDQTPLENQNEGHPPNENSQSTQEQPGGSVGIKGNSVGGEGLSRIRISP